MARIRTIKPEFWTHPVMGRADDSVKCLAIALLNHADDEGYFLADPLIVRSVCRPYDDTSGTTTVLLRELSENGWIIIRHHSEIGAVGFVVNFTGHQTINKAKVSKLKKYYESGSDTVLIPDEDGNDTVGKGKEGKGKELSSSSSYLSEKITTEVGEATKMTITDFRFVHQQNFGTNMPAGCNGIAHELCQQFSKEVIIAAFEAAAVQGKTSVAYVKGVLLGSGQKKKPGEIKYDYDEVFGKDHFNERGGAKNGT